MSTICCLTGPSNPSFISASLSSDANEQQESQRKEKANYNIVFNRHVPPMTYSHNMPLSSRSSHYNQQQQQQQHHPLLYVSEEVEIPDLDNLHDNDKLLLPRSTRVLKRRTSLFEKSRDWARRLMTMHRARRNTISNEKFRSSCYDFHRKASMRKTPYPEALHNNRKSFDEDGYLSPMEIQAKLDHISREKANRHSSLSKLSSHSPQLLVYSHSSSDITRPIYRCHGSMNSSSSSSTPKCTCQQHDSHLSRPSHLSDFHQSLSAVDYIDDDVAEEDPTKPIDGITDDDPLNSLKYLFVEQEKPAHQQVNLPRRVARRSTNTSSISTDSGYCDMPMTSSKLIPVHLISCTLIPVNVTRTDSMDLHCLPCTCPPSSSSMYSSQSAASECQRRQRKSSAYSSRSHQNRIVTGAQMERIDDDRCSCNQKYYSTMTICPTLSFSSANGNKSFPKINDYPRDDEDKHSRQTPSRRKRTSVGKFPVVTDDLNAISRWYRPHLERDAVCHALQQADYGAFILRDSTTHGDCYALSVKVPKFTHDSNIAHYLIERTVHQHTYHYRIKGTLKQFPTLLSLITHHSVMPEILPITLNLRETLAIG